MDSVVGKPCKECGEPIRKDNYLDPVGSEIREQQVCFECHFWLLHVKAVDDPKSIRTNGKHARYREPSDCPGDFKGFAGREFLILFNDGRIAYTNDLWYQGEIPERFRDRLPDNAVVITLEG